MVCLVCKWEPGHRLHLHSGVIRLYFNQDPSSALSTHLILYVCILCLFSFLLSFLGKFSYENLQPYFS